MSTIKTANIQGLSSANPNVIVNNDGTISLGSGSVSKSTNGYLKLPDGLILQWGYVYTASYMTVTYPIAFPHAVFNILISDTSTDTTGGIVDSSSIQSADINNLTSFHVSVVGPSNGVMWMAIGY